MADHHRALVDLLNFFTNEYESIIADSVLVFVTFILYLPSSIVFGGKFFEHCVQQRKNPYYLKQSWITQFFVCVVQNTTGSSLAYLICGKMPNILENASFLIPFTFCIWYLAMFCPFDAAYRFYTSRLGYPFQIIFKTFKELRRVNTAARSFQLAYSVFIVNTDHKNPILVLLVVSLSNIGGGFSSALFSRLFGSPNYSTPFSNPGWSLQSSVFYSLFFFITTDTQGYFFIKRLLSQEICFVGLFIFALVHGFIMAVRGKQHTPLIFSLVLGPLQFLSGISSNTIPTPDSRFGSHKIKRQ